MKPGFQFALLTMTIITSTYGCAVILLGPVMPLPLFHPWFAWAVWNTAPLALLASALWAGFRMRQFRLMAKMREIRSIDPGALLARGEAIPKGVRTGISGPERLCHALALLSLITIPVCLGLPSPWLWISTGLGFWLLVRWMLPAR